MIIIERFDIGAEEEKMKQILNIFLSRKLFVSSDEKNGRENDKVWRDKKYEDTIDCK